jgi:hypothetical protein
VLDVVELPKSHTGLNLAVAFQSILNEFRIENKVSARVQMKHGMIQFTLKQILSVTCDNASNNDTMVDELAVSLPNWTAVNRTRCFAHIVNLIAKSLLKQFDVKSKKKKGDKDTHNNESDHELDDIEVLVVGLDDEEETMAQELDVDDDNIEDEDDVKGWVDELEELTEEERKDLLMSICPVSRTLVKVRSLIVCLPCMTDNSSSFKNSHSRSYTRLHSSFQPGRPALKLPSFLSSSCLATWQPNGTQHTTC